MSRFPKLLTGLFRDFRNSYNEGVDKIDSELDLQKKRVDDLIKGTPQPSEIVDARGGHPVLRDRLNQVDAQLAQTEQEVGNVDGRVDNIKSLFFNQHKKRVKLELPLRHSDYATIIANNGYSYIYPQGFYVDEVANELFIVFAPTEGSGNNYHHWVSVYDWGTGEYKSSFSAGTANGEGCYVGYENGRRYIYLKGDSETVISRYDITNLPSNLTRLIADMTYNVDLKFQFTGRKGKFYIENYTPAVSAIGHRNVFTKYNNDFTQIEGQLTFSIVDSGDQFSYRNYYPKRQGIAVGDGFFVGGYGGFYSSGSPIPSEYSGVKVFDENGNSLASSLLDPSLMMNTLVAHGIPATRIENEGVYVSNENQIYSMFITSDRLKSESLTSGIVIFEEFSQHKEAIDFKEGVAPVLTYPKDLTVYYPPRINTNGMYNPITGEKFNTLNDIVTFMAEVDCRLFDFYTSSFGAITDFSGNALPNSVRCTIYNRNNTSFFYDLKGASLNESYIVTGTPYVATRIQQLEVELDNYTVPMKNGGFVIQMTNDTQLTFKVKGMDGVVRSTSLTLT